MTTLRPLGIPSLDPEILLHQAIVWFEAESYDRAERGFREVLAADPSNADAVCHLGLIAYLRKEGAKAERLMRAAIALEPKRAQFQTYLGSILVNQGEHAGAIAAYRRATELHPDHLGSWGGLVFAMDLHPYAPAEQRLADRRRLNAHHCAALTASAPPHANDRDPDRVLKVGYLSGDFREHSASTVFGLPLKHHDPARVEPHVYYQRECPEDAITRAFRERLPNWTEIQHLDDEMLADRIRRDGIDILVDLSGFSAGHRVMALARKPAPVIITAWGHVTGLGIDACDYILADEVCIPPEHDDLYHERALYAPCVVAYEPREPYPPVAPPPQERNGYVTFGYLGRARKTSEIVWAAWGEILRRVPNSRLLLKGGEYADAVYERRVREAFYSMGVAPHRLEIRKGTPHHEHLATYGELDVALDPFPQGGGVTTLEASLMGVPSIALLGDYINARIAPSILNAIGYWDMVAESVDAYVEKAVALPGWHRTLDARMELRAALLRSVICDAERYTRGVEDAYRQAWRAWATPTEEPVAEDPAAGPWTTIAWRPINEPFGVGG